MPTHTLSVIVSIPDPSVTRMVIETVLFGILLLLGFALGGLLIAFFILFSPVSVSGYLIALLILFFLATGTFIFIKMLKNIRKRKRELRKQKKSTLDTPTN